jgi:hypothetical protein
MPGASEIAGRATVTDGRVVAGATVYRGEEEVASCRVEGEETGMPAPDGSPE